MKKVVAKKAPVLKVTKSEKSKSASKDPRRLPAGTKKVDVLLTRSDWLDLLASTAKYPLSTRAAGELFRGGVRCKLFDKWTVEGNMFSTNVGLALEQIESGKGIDVERIPPLSPVFVQIETKKVRKVRPSAEEAEAEAKKLVHSLRAAGWKEEDLRGAFAKALPAVKADEVQVDIADEAPIAPVKVIKVIWPAGHIGVCCHCHYRLNGVAVRCKRVDEEKFDDMHHGCYLMKEEKPGSLFNGMLAFIPAEGVAYEWNEKKSQWAEVGRRNGTGGVPASDGEDSK